MSALPYLPGHGAPDKAYGPLDVDGVALPSDGPGVPLYGYTRCACGERSPVLHSSRERRLWHTRH